MRLFRTRSSTTLAVLSLLAVSMSLTGTKPAQAYTGTINFTDVGRINGNGPGIYFIADNGWVGGYSGSQCSNVGVGSPCFLPNDSATRGQISKFLANAKTSEGAVLQNPPVNTFADVPVGSTFYIYIETVNYYGWASGYPCGGAGEPCDGQNRPYFRVYNTTTRGQFAKMVTRAMNNVRMYIAPTTAHFNDVPVGSTFYSYVETAYAHFAMAPVSTGVFGVNNSVLRGDVATAFFRLTALERQFTHNGSSGHSGPYEGSNNYVLGPPLSCTNPTPNMSGAYQDTPAGSEAGFTQDYGGFSNFGVIGREISFSPNAKAYLACTASNKVAIVFHVFNNVGSNPSYASGCQAGTWDYPSFATNLPDAGQVVKPGCTFSNAEIRIYSNSPNLLDTSSAQYFVYDDWTPDNGNNRGEINIDNYQLNSNNDPISVNGYDAKDNMQKFCMRKGDSGASYAGNQYGVFPCP